jgi:hypothetical protein
VAPFGEKVEISWVVFLGFYPKSAVRNGIGRDSVGALLVCETRPLLQMRTSPRDCIFAAYLSWYSSWFGMQKRDDRYTIACFRSLEYRGLPMHRCRMSPLPDSKIISQVSPIEAVNGVVSGKMILFHVEESVGLER